MQVCSENVDYVASAGQPAPHGSAHPAKKIHRQQRVDAKKRKRAIENSEYRDMLSRLLRGMAKRVSSGDPEDLVLLATLAREVDVHLKAAVTAQRAVQEISWSRLAKALGVTRQGAQQRFGRR